MMQGYDGRALSKVDVELKEAVCDSLVNMLTKRVSGTDELGSIVYGRSPRRGIVSGQLLPRFSSVSVDDTSDIKIAALGVDFVVDASSDATLRVAPRFSVYVRVLPTWKELSEKRFGLEIDFRLIPIVQKDIDDKIRHRRQEAFAAAGLDRPKWKEMSEVQRADTRRRRTEIQDAIRAGAYAEYGISLTHSDLTPPENVIPETPGAAAEETNADTAGAPETPESAVLPIGRLLREGRQIPFAHIRPAQIPGKWKRIDLILPAMDWSAALTGVALNSHVDAFNSTMAASISQQLSSWLNTEGAHTGWRKVTISPADAVNEASYERFLDNVRLTPPAASSLIPDLRQVKIKVERQLDFLDPSSASIRVVLDNDCVELSPTDASSMCNAIFGTELELTVPIADHRYINLDRVEPSYRFRHYLKYPAIGLNCGVGQAERDGETSITTTWAPRFQQPRVVPRQVKVEYKFKKLADPSFDVAELLELPRAYKKWVEDGKRSLSVSIREGLSHSDADLETKRFETDIAGQLAEADYIERGVRLLVVSREAASKLVGAKGDQAKDLERRAAPWKAWVMTNEAFALRDAYDADRGWRLFQMAFILAHIPTFASRMPEYRLAFNEERDEQGASLLYFPTGGGKSEAFYGTLLFAVFLDRLRGKSRGVTAMIRYPLRLLTLQQAQRLLKLLAQAEIVRLRHQVGNWPIEIGFWVGSSNTPNRYSGIKADVPLFGNTDHPDDELLEEYSPGDDEAKAEGRRYREIREAFNKVPQCPCCSALTGLRRLENEGKTAKRVAIVCFNPVCSWNVANRGITPLPFLLTDDAIYQRAPAVILGTVDKLAMLGQSTPTITNLIGMFGLARWIGPTGHLYNPRSNEELDAGPLAKDYRPVFPAYASGDAVFHDPFPSLVIQDEAHLLEESLGTFSGLFDSLLDVAFQEIDRIAGDKLAVARRTLPDGTEAPRLPKIIAATATISDPDRQLKTLYQRKPLRFPYPGPDIYRSFFSEPDKAPDYNAARVALSQSMPQHLAPEATAPWMRLYVSLMTNDATHTVTTVNVLSAFHTMISRLWNGLLEPSTTDRTIQTIRDNISPGLSGDWRTAAIDRSVADGRQSDIQALIDLHRIALAYVTNKKGGDQIIDAMDSAVAQRHRAVGIEHQRFDSRLISGGVDMRQIQMIMADAEVSFTGRDYPPIHTTLRNIVATSAISHGVDVDRFNSMFFAGLPSDIAEYIQASSRVGRTHVGFVMLLPTPQSRRDRYVVETHDVFHRFLERMIAPPAVERWAENAIRRAFASFVQTWAMLREAGAFVEAKDDKKPVARSYDSLDVLKNLVAANPVRFSDDLGSFMLAAMGFAGRGAEKLGSPPYAEFYREITRNAAGDFGKAMTQQSVTGQLRDYWADIGPVFKKPMTSLRDVDEAGIITASAYDPHSKETSKRVDLSHVTQVMKVIRSQKGDFSEADAETDSDRNTA